MAAIRLSGRKDNRVRITALRIMIAIVATLMMAWPAAAALSGTSGLIHTPTADILNPGEGEFAAYYYDGALHAAVGYGIFDRIEIGINTLSHGAAPLNLGLAAKGLVVEESSSVPAVAVGFETGQSYAVASMALAQRIRGHVGLAMAARSGGSSSGLFGGAAFNLSTAAAQGGVQLPPTTLMAEVTPGGWINLGARVIVTPSLSIDAALVDFDTVTAGIAVRAQF